MALTKIRTSGITADAVDNTILKLDDNYAFSGSLSSSVGQSFVPEFIGNLYLAGNTTDAAELTGCFTNTHQIYRIVGEVGASFSAESSTRFFFLSGTDTKLSSGYYGRGLAYDDASTSSGTAQADGSYFKININQSSTGSSIVDMHFYRKQSGYQVLGMSGYHDQSSDRGYFHFGFKNNSSLELTGFRLENDNGNNMSAINFSVYGYRLRQNSSGEMLGAYQ